jgi:glycosyltransferase involved in cell wall biosynthesis
VVCIQEVLGKNGLGYEMTLKVCAIIPAFNESEAITGVIRGVKKYQVDPIVIDDGSSDDTFIAAKNENIHVIRHAQRTGKGFSLKDGFDYALKAGYNLVFTIDGDGQHDTDAIPKFLDKISKHNCSIVIGNRMNSPEDMPLIRVMTNRFMSFIISLICGQYISDTQCGYRLFSKDAIAAIDIRSRKFEIESEILIKLARKGFRVDSVPIKSIYADETSKIRPVRDTFRFIWFILRMLFKK